MLADFAANQKRWEAEVLNESLEEASLEEAGATDGDADAMATAAALDEMEKVGTGAGILTKKTAAAMLVSSCMDRRMSLPSSHHDPLHRIFDQMLQPDAAGMTSADFCGLGAGGGSLRVGSAGGAVNLKRNFSLTDRRRSSLLRGLYTRSSLKPLGGRAGRLSRPTSASLEATAESSAASGGGGGRVSGLRTLQPMENRLEDSVTVPADLMDLSHFEEEEQKQLLAVFKKNFPPPSANNNDDDMMMTAEREKENTTGGSPFNLYQRLTQRRGSAPSNLVLADSKLNSSGCAGGSLLVRQQSSLAMNNAGGGNRRGSLPSELLADSLPKQLRSRIHGSSAVGGGGNGGGGSKSSKGLLRRRSMGPEMLNLNHHPGVKERPMVQKYLNRPF
jgi:hypothetical protein